MSNRSFRGIMAAAIMLLLTISPRSYAQFGDDFDAGSWLKAGVDDGLLLMEDYLAPYVKAFGAGFGSAWFNTAKPHKPGGFDITISVSAGFVPDQEKEMDLADINFANLTLVNPGNSLAPTVAGDKTGGPALHYMTPVPGFPALPEVEVINFNTPRGTGLGVVPSPVVQAGVGLPLGSEIKLRYVPRIPIGEGGASLMGGGLLHSITQYFNAFELIPVNISLFGGYSRLAVSLPLEVNPDSYANYVSYTLSDFNDQSFDVDVSGWNVSLIGSVDIPLFTAYTSVGYSKTTTIMEIQGNIPMPVIDPTISTTSPVYTDSGVLTDIEKVKIEYFSGIKFNIGARLKLGVLTLSADYTRARYNVITGAIGISFR